MEEGGKGGREGGSEGRAEAGGHTEAVCCTPARTCVLGGGSKGLKYVLPFCVLEHFHSALLHALLLLCLPRVKHTQLQACALPNFQHLNLPSCLALPPRLTCPVRPPTCSGSTPTSGVPGVCPSPCPSTPWCLRMCLWRALSTASTSGVVTQLVHCCVYSVLSAQRQHHRMRSSPHRHCVEEQRN
jgi:hypothetical protein